MTHEKLNDLRVSYYEAKKGGWLQRMVRRLTRWAWKAHVRAPINRMHERGLINSRVYHEAHDYATRIIYETPPPAQPPNSGVITNSVCSLTPETPRKDKPNQ